MMRIPFNVSARTALLIGRENVSNANGAIIELVKNAYDADATCAVVFFENNALYIIDNGHGMDENIIKNQWMTIGTDTKNVDPYSPGKRVKTGAKGIGRFALDRLGQQAEMYTLPKDQKTGYHWTIDWQEFERKDITIDKVQAALESLPDLDMEEKLPAGAWKSGVQIGFPRGGTIIKISSLRDRWTDDNLRELYRNLETLVPSTEDEESFSVALLAPGTEEVFGPVRSLIDDAFDCKISAVYDSKEKKVHITIERDELDVEELEKRYGAVFKEESMREEQYSLATFKRGAFSYTYHLSEVMRGYDDSNKLLEDIGDFRFNLSFAKNSAPNKEDLLKYPYKTVDYATRKLWLRKFGGIRLFRDNFRVRPYGENGDDWLRLGERAAGSPAGAGQRLGGYRLRPNQVVGAVHISRLENINFQDKSSREGIQHNAAFALFTQLLTDIIALLEKDRNVIFFSLSELHRRTDAEEIRSAAAEDAAKRIKDGNEEKIDKDDAIVIVEELESKKNKLQNALEENKILRSLASAGIVTAAAAHELKGLENFLRTRNDDMRSLLKRHIPVEVLDSVQDAFNPYILLEQMRKTDESLSEWISYALTPLRRDRRSAKPIYLKPYLDSLNETWKNLLEHRGIALEVAAFDDGFKIKTFPIDLDTIFYNLLINSVESFTRSKKRESRRIEINCGPDDKFYRIAYRDNGVGLDKAYKDRPRDIFLPQETTKRDSEGQLIGTGMGMYLVKSVVDENRGRITILPESDGFRLEIFLPAYHA